MKIFISYRMGMRVRELMVVRSARDGETGYYVCPRCSETLEREMSAFCDRCGQKLDWSKREQVRVLRPKGNEK